MLILRWEKSIISTGNAYQRIISVKQTESIDRPANHDHQRRILLTSLNVTANAIAVTMSRVCVRHSKLLVMVLYFQGKTGHALLISMDS